MCEEDEKSRESTHGGLLVKSDTTMNDLVVKVWRMPLDATEDGDDGGGIGVDEELDELGEHGERLGVVQQSDRELSHLGGDGGLLHQRPAEWHRRVHRGVWDQHAALDLLRKLGAVSRDCLEIRQPLARAD